MQLKDILYGSFDISEDVLIELIKSKPVQRLKHLAQFGLPYSHYYKKGFSRYEHSIGVMLLLRHLGASLEEQIAGLLHDISHTAFSHVYDWVIGNESKEDYQDQIYKSFLHNTEIPEILLSFSFSPSSFENLESFSLLEKPKPHLCADRLDYSLREIAVEDSLAKAKTFFEDLTVFQKQIAFRTSEKALQFGKEYLKLNNEHWAGPYAKTSYRLLADALKRALKLGVLNPDDFFKTDEEVLDILYKSQDKEILNILNSLASKSFPFDSSLQKNQRFVDPEVLINKKIVPVSSIFPEYRALISSF